MRYEELRLLRLEQECREVGTLEQTGRELEDPRARFSGYDLVVRVRSADERTRESMQVGEMK